MAFNADIENDFQDLVTDVDAFYNEETDPNVMGKVLSITEMELAGRDTLVAVLKLTAPCQAVKGKGSAKETVNLEVGQMLGVVIKHKLQDIHSMVDNQCELMLSAKEKIPVPGGKTMWKYAVRFRGRRTGLAERAATSQESRKNPEPSSKGATAKDDSIEQF